VTQETNAAVWAGGRMDLFSKHCCPVETAKVLDVVKLEENIMRLKTNDYLNSFEPFDIDKHGIVLHY
jgi:hypothetical protein